jgi:hypothetical protein
MDIVAHGLWAGAAAVAAQRAGVKVRPVWAAAWAMFPDVLAFGPPVAVGLWMLVSGAAGSARPGHAGVPHVHLGAPLYPLGHSLVTFAVVFGLVTLAMRRPPLAMLGWLTHILIDIPTHSNSYYATRFLWPLSGYSINGVPWWTPWLWVCTYVGLAITYLVLWRKGWLTRTPGPTRPS